MERCGVLIAKNHTCGTMIIGHFNTVSVFVFADVKKRIASEWYQNERKIPNVCGYNLCTIPVGFEFGLTVRIVFVEVHRHIADCAALCQGGGKVFALGVQSVRSWMCVTFAECANGFSPSNCRLDELCRRCASSIAHQCRDRRHNGSTALNVWATHLEHSLCRLYRWEQRISFGQCIDSIVAKQVDPITSWAKQFAHIRFERECTIVYILYANSESV